MTTPVLFDRPLALKRLARARRLAVPGADFLLARAAEDLGDRLAAVTRRFPHAAALGDVTGRIGAALAASGRAESLVRLSPLPGADLLGDEERLPFAPASLALAVSLLSLHWANDLPGALIQIRRALQPDGLLLVALIGGDTLTELRQSLMAAEDELTGGAALRVAPFVDVRALGSLLQRAGFALPVTDSDRVTVRYASLFALIADLRAMGATNCLAERPRPLTRAVITRAAAIYQERFSDADGRIRATFEIISGSGWVPHESQQQPLKPGSAKMRLADALNVPEGRLPGGEG